VDIRLLLFRAGYTTMKNTEIMKNLINSEGVELLRSSGEIRGLAPSCACGLQGVIHIEVLRTFCYASFIPRGIGG
jgi:hypothetical protein